MSEHDTGPYVDADSLPAYNAMRERAKSAEAEVERLREAMSAALYGIDNLRGYRCAEQRPFLAHVDHIHRGLCDALNERPM